MVPDQLVGRLLMVLSEHHADARQHRVELGVAERQGLGVGLPPFEADATLGGQPAAVLQQLRAQVAGDDAGARGRGGECGVAGAGGYIEHAIVGRRA